MTENPYTQKKLFAKTNNQNSSIKVQRKNYIHYHSTVMRKKQRDERRENHQCADCGIKVKPIKKYPYRCEKCYDSNKKWSIKVKNEKKLILGGGSNMLFTGNYDGIVIRNMIEKIEIESENVNEIETKLKLEKERGCTIRNLLDSRLCQKLLC